MVEKKLLTKKVRGKKVYWSKKIKGQVHYFGPDYEQALQAYFDKKSLIENGPSIVTGDSISLGDLFNYFLTDVTDRYHQGSLSHRTLKDYEEVMDLIASKMDTRTPLLDLRTFDFQTMRNQLVVGKNGKKVSPQSQNRRLGYARTIFRFASVDNQFVDSPLPCSRAFKKVPAKEVRKHRSQKPQRFLTAAEIRQIIDDAPVDFKAIYLLAINGGWNNSDLRALMVSDLESIEDGVIRYCREKTGIERSTPLWPETLAAVKEWLKIRPVSVTRHAFVECSPMPDGCSDGNSRVSKVFFCPQWLLF